MRYQEPYDARYLSSSSLVKQTINLTLVPMDRNYLNRVSIALNNVTNYTLKRLKAESVQPKELELNEMYIYGLLMASTAQSSSMNILARNLQTRGALAILRVLQEINIHFQLINIDESTVWSHYLLLQSEKENIKNLKHLHKENLLTNDDLNSAMDKHATLIDKIKKLHPTLPATPGVITTKRNLNIESIHMSTRQLCNIIDYHKEGNVDGAVTQSYATLYKYLSEFVHTSPRSIDRMFSYGNNHVVTEIDINGSKEIETLGKCILTVTIYQMEILDYFNVHIGTKYTDKEEYSKLDKEVTLLVAKDTNTATKS